MKINDGSRKPETESYSARKKASDMVKGKGRPLGGAPPIPEGTIPNMFEEEQGVDDEPPPPIYKGDQTQHQIQGVGAAYAANQALSHGETDGPINLKKAKRMQVGAGQGRGVISPETREMLEGAAEAAQGEQDSAKEELEGAEKDMVESGREFPMLDFEALATARNQLLSPERKKAIEDLLEPLDITDLVTSREIEQTIPSVPGKIAYTLRTFSQRENIWCLQYVSKGYTGSDRYMEELLSTFKVVCALVGINNKPMLEHRVNVGQRGEAVDEKRFEAKLDVVLSLPVQMLADIGIQCNWLNDRVNSLFTAETVKNG